jgi:hypothetical protein
MITKGINLKDWKRTPLYRQKIEGLTELESIFCQCPEYEVVRLCNFSRDEKDPDSYSTKILLEMSLMKVCDLTEVEYQQSVLKKRDFSIEDLLVLY